MNHLVSVVILNWNGKHFLEKFLKGVVQNSPRAEIVVADNASTDGSLAYLKKEFPEVRLIEFDQNHGFCGGYNRALQQIDSKYFVLLNSDVEVTPGWLDPLIEVVEDDDQIGVVQPKIKLYDRKDYFEYAGAAGGFIDKFGYPFCRGRIFDELEEDKGQYDQSMDIFWATGACFLIRSELYHRFGGLDEHFFAHMEEIDLCWTILNHNYKIKCITNSEVFHIGGGTLPKSNPRKTYLNHRNGLFLMYKNLPRNIRGRIIFQRMLLDALSAILYLFKGRFGDFAALLKSHLHYHRDHGKLEVSDRTIHPKNLPGFYDKSVLVDYFLIKRRKFSKLRWN
jgi:hypothetical protein